MSQRKTPGAIRGFVVVRDTRIELVTSSVSGKRSPTELIARVWNCAAVEVATGIEPVYTALQAAASPLRHLADDCCRTISGQSGSARRCQNPGERKNP